MENKAIQVKFGIEAIIKGADGINAAITKVRQNDQKTQKHLHLTAVSCMVHADEHGDITLMQRLLDTVSKAYRRNALIQWATDFGKFRWDEKNKVLCFNKHKVTDLEKAMDVPFWDHTKEPEHKSMDLVSELFRLIQRAEKRLAAQAEGKAKVKDSIDQELLRDLEQRIDYKALVAKDKGAKAAKQELAKA